MRRVSRLFEILEIIRSRKMTTAQYLSERLELSTRTIYRHIHDLQASGIPINANAGKGFTLDESFSLPPVAFSNDEIEALAFGARLVENYADEALAQAARQAIAKIDAILPPHRRRMIDEAPVYPSIYRKNQPPEHLGTLRQAIHERRYVDINYVTGEGEESKRRIRPLAVTFWDRSLWTVPAWCELRNDFRAFRIDRIQSLNVSMATYPDEPDKNIAAFLKSMGFSLD